MSSDGRITEHHAPENAYIVTLCGSMRFKDVFSKIEAKLALEGKIVFTPTIFRVLENQPIEVKLTDDQHAVLDKVHRMKIDMSNEVLIVNPGGYIGNDTRDEIIYAKEKGIKICYLTDLGEYQLYSILDKIYE